MSAKITNISDFSKKYDRIITDTDDSFIIKKTVLVGVDKVKLIGKDLPANLVHQHQKKKLQYRLSALTLTFCALLCIGLTVVFNRNLYFIVFLWSAFFHESSHILVAKIIKSFNIRFGFDVKYLIFPIIYISNKDIYDKPKAKRLWYYSAGPIFNLSVALISFILILVFKFNSAWLNIVMNTNLVFGLYNLYPFMFTDGYNILRELIEIYNLRGVLINCRFNLSKLYKRGKIYFYYAIFIIISYFIALYSLVIWLYKLV